MTNEQLDKAIQKTWSLRLSDIQSAYTKAMSLLEYCEFKGYQKGIADCCRVLGYCFWRFSDYSLSLSHSLRGLSIYQRLGDIQGEADILNNIGAVYMFQGDNIKRLEVNLRCKELRSQIGDLEGVASSEGNIGETYLEMGKYDNAMACFEAVLSDPNASPQGIAWAYHNMGRIKQMQRDYQNAFTHYKQGLDLSESVSYNVLITDSYVAITELLIEQELYDQAISQAERALDVSRKIGAKEGEKKALYYLSKIYEELGQFEASLRYHKDYHSIDMEISRDTEIERLKTTQLKAAYDKIEEQKNELVDSIRYAERIQNAVLTRDQHQQNISRFFVLYQAKDIVSGDFYWYYEKDDWFYLCVADCTGHGVPGALLTMLGTTYLNDIVGLYEDLSPAKILELLRERLIESLSRKTILDGSRDGMDISLIKMNTSTYKAEWAGAFNPLWVIRKGSEELQTSGPVEHLTHENFHLYEIKGDRIPVGDMDELLPFKNHYLELRKGDHIYMFSDGFADQFGGDQGKKYRTGRLKQTLLSIQEKEIEQQGEHLKQEFTNWKRNLEQVDDLCFLGVRI